MGYLTNNKTDSTSRIVDAAFVLIVTATYLSTAALIAYSPMRPPTAKLPLVTVLAAAYLLIGIYGFRKCRTDGSLKKAIIYSLVQLILASILQYLSQVFIFAFILL